MFKPKCIANSFCQHSANEYMQAQAKLAEDCTLHIQIAGTGGNREYGCAFELEVPCAFAEWFEKFTRSCVRSFATPTLYVPIQVRISGTELVVQVAGPFGDYPAFNEVTAELSSATLAMLTETAVKPASTGCYNF